MTQKTLKEILNGFKANPNVMVKLFNRDGENIDTFLVKDWNKESKRQMSDYAFGLINDKVFGYDVVQSSKTSEVYAVEIDLNW